MFGRRVTLFKIFNFEVRLDTSWLIIALLGTWSLAKGFFPHYDIGLSATIYWWMGLVGALGLFASIVFHELCHSLVARRFGLPMRGITLFVFGGVAEMEEEPPSARSEFFMAIAGPISSIALGFIFYGVYILGQQNGWPMATIGVFGYLRTINFVLAIFNLLPAFPLDGGRMLRSVLWGLGKNLRWATRVASQIGSGFGLGMMFLGIMFIIRGGFIGGIWWFLLGMFLSNAAQMTYQRLLMRRGFEGEPVEYFMKTDIVTVSPSISVAEFVEEYIYKYHYRMFPVVEGKKLIGYVSTREVKEIPRQDWGQRRVTDILKPRSSENTFKPNTDAMKALSIMSRTGNSRFMVAKDDEILGIITLKDLLRFFSLKLDLEGEEFKRI
ncbi:MAG: site-2 protease family protein [Candidatus Omnitrophota bacterium]|nr:MAG: site-2 protease family protein [Candidatus Omnitrophota bacterium]